jgi:phage-related protein
MGQWLAYINPKLDEIHKNMSALWDKVKQIWNEALNAIATAIRNAYVNYIKPEVDFLADGILKIWHDLIDPVYNIGSDIVDGLSQGISDAWGRFKSGIVEMADKGKALFQEVFGVGSPSTFTTWIGEMLGKGMSQGMTNSIGGVMDSAKSMMSGVTGALGGSFSPTMNMAGAMAGGGGMAGQRGAGGRYNVEIPLVVNGREIARAIAPDIDQQLERQRKITVRAKGV